MKGVPMETTKQKGYLRPFCLFVMIALLFFCTRVWMPEWSIEYIIDGKVISNMGDDPLCLDPEGLPHVVYGGDYRYHPCV
jgi:hypothetical protein